MLFRSNADRRMMVKEGDTLSLGKHELTFVMAPMVHWPEVMMTYDSTDKVLFSADGFGKFGALDVEEDWACEARRYYIGAMTNVSSCFPSDKVSPSFTIILLSA